MESMSKNEGVVIDIGGITAYGERNNWYGSIEVSRNGIKGGNMAHIMSLGKIILKQNFLEDIGHKKIKLGITNSLKLKIEVIGEKPVGQKETIMSVSPKSSRRENSFISSDSLKEGLTTYLAQEFEYPHEREMFDELINKLEVSLKDHKAILVGNFFLKGRQIDAALFKDDAIIVIELKDYSGKVEGGEEGKWKVGNTEMENPYKQVHSYKFGLLDKLRDNSVEIFGKQKSKSINLGHISAIVLFRGGIYYNERESMPPKTWRWFYVTDLQRIGKKIYEIISPELRTTHSERMKILKILGIDESMLYRGEGVEKIEDKTRLQSTNRGPVTSANRYLKLNGNRKTSGITQNKVMCFIPCCKGKSSSGDIINPGYSLSNQDLPNTFDMLLAGRSAMEECIKYDTPKTSAINLYNGKLYHPLIPYKDEIIKLIQSNKLRVTIISAGYGIVDALEPIHKYEAILQGHVASSWKRNGLANIIAEYIIHNQPSHVYGFFSGKGSWSSSGSQYRYFFTEGLKIALMNGFKTKLSGCFYKIEGGGFPSFKELTSLGNTFVDLLKAGFNESYIINLQKEGRREGDVKIGFDRISL